MATLEELTERIRAVVDQGEDLGKSLKFDLKGAGVIHVDGQAVSNEDKPADLTVTISIADLVALGQRRLDPMSAMMTRRLRLSDMGLAMSLQPRMQAIFAQMR